MHSRRAWLSKCSGIALSGLLTGIAAERGICAGGATGPSEFGNAPPARDDATGTHEQLLAAIDEAPKGHLALDRMYEVRRPVAITKSLTVTSTSRGGVLAGSDFPAGEFVFHMTGVETELSLVRGRFITRGHGRYGLLWSRKGGKNKVALARVEVRGFTQEFGGGLYLYDMEGVDVQNCLFDECENAILVFGNSRNVVISNNEFRRWRVNAVRVSGFSGERSTSIRIDGNLVHGSVGNQSAIYVPCIDGVRHSNVRIANNVCVGRGLDFPNGNADLISTFGIEHLVCENNTARLGGDLGIAIEEVHDGMILANTCESNNYGGITVERSRRIQVIRNACIDNGIDKGKKADRTAAPLAGIRIQGPAEEVVVADNACGDTSGGRYQDAAIVVDESRGTVRDLELRGNAGYGHRLGLVYPSNAALGRAK